MQDRDTRNAGRGGEGCRIGMQGLQFGDIGVTGWGYKGDRVGM